MRKFAKKREYEVITPETTLEELEAFFKKGENKGASFALVTDAGEFLLLLGLRERWEGADEVAMAIAMTARRFTLGVVTPEDLHK